MKKYIAVAGIIGLMVFLLTGLDQPLPVILKQINSGSIAYALTEPAEMIAILGKPVSKKEKTDGGMIVLFLQFKEFQAFFAKMRRDKDKPYTLRGISYRGKGLDIGREKKITPRILKDLKKLNSFEGFQNISLIKLDLRSQKDILLKTCFDTLTEWPEASRLPEGFNPAQLLERGKKRGLGIPALHEQKLNGRGVGIAIIDQPLLLGHQEYTAALMRYDKTGLGDMAPQMHGSPVASIAVGKTIGVAPGASLSYFAVPTWIPDNIHYANSVNRVIDLNKIVPEKEKIRVISISTGIFKRLRNHSKYLAAVKEAERAGVLVITCAYDGLLKFGTVERIPGTNPEDPDNYRPGRYACQEDNLRVPTGNLTYASHRGSDVYVYYVHGGRSWAAPYLAGLAAIAFQVNPGLQPKQVIQYFLESAHKTKAGPVVNPIGFIALVKKTK